MHSPIIFIASRDYYDESDSETQRQILGQDNLYESDMLDLLSSSVIGADYINLDKQDQWNPEDVFEGNTSVEIIDESKDHGIATLKVNKEAYFKNYVHTLGEYHKILEKRLENGEINYDYSKEYSETDHKTIYDFTQMTKPYGGVQFILDGDEVYYLSQLMNNYMPNEYYINVAYAADYHY